jgi:hypothetical protein
MATRFTFLRLGSGAFVAGVILLCVPQVHGEDKPALSEAEIDRALERAAAFIWRLQDAEGHWQSSRLAGVHPMGADALSAYALWESGTQLPQARFQPAVAGVLDRTELGSVFTRSYTSLLWSVIGPEQFRREIEDDVRFLKLQQADTGGWGYGATVRGPAPDWRDNFHSASALFALEQAEWVNVDVASLIWRRAERHWLDQQNPDGGWGFPAGNVTAEPRVSRSSYGTMTAAGLSSLHVIHDHLHRDAALGFNGRFKARCGESTEESRAILGGLDRGWAWMDSRFRADKVPDFFALSEGDARDASLPLYQFQVSRLGRLSGRKRIGHLNWHREIAGQLLASQQMDGAWGDLESTSYGILALTHARGPILINKMQYGVGDGWNTDPHDADHLTRWLGRRWEVEVGWQLAHAEKYADDVFDAPVLLITGHDAPAFSDRERDALRAFVEAGGTVLAVACCSREEFVEGCREAFTSMFPAQSYGPLAEDHPVWRIGDEIVHRANVFGLWDGCRTSVFVLPDASCCAWQQMLTGAHVRSFLLADNIFRYALFARPLGGRLTPHLSRPTDGAARRTIRVARLRHGGDWNADPGALEYLSTWMQARFDTRLDVIPPVGGEQVSRTDAAALWLTGHTFDDNESVDVSALRAFLYGGGTLIATACCGSEAFDRSIQAFVAEHFGDGAWKPVIADDPIISGSVNPVRPSPLTDMAYRARVHSLPPARMDRPRLLGVRHDDRWIILYSPSDLNCGLVGHNCPTCVGLSPNDARRTATNLLYYANGLAEHRDAGSDEEAGSADR